MKRLGFFCSYLDGNRQKAQFRSNLSQLFNVFQLTTPKSWSESASAAEQIKQLDGIVIWNGNEPGCGWCKTIADAVGVPWVVGEMGLLPQKGFFHIDPDGIVGRSSLCGDLSWVTDDHVAQYRRYRESHFQGATWREGEYILCPMQLPQDSAILMDSPYKTMDSFLTAVRERYPGQPILASPHPLRRGFRPSVEGVEVYSGALSTIQLAASCRLVVGLNSTVLYETAALGAPTTALASCALRSGATERLLAAAVAESFRSESLQDMTPAILSAFGRK